MECQSQHLRECASATVRTPAALSRGGGFKCQAVCDTVPVVLWHAVAPATGPHSWSSSHDPDRSIRFAFCTARWHCVEFDWPKVAEFGVAIGVRHASQTPSTDSTITITITITMTRLLEIRTYRLRPGTVAAFHSVMHNLAAPMLRREGMDVVAYGSSNHEEETYFLVRSYKDRAALESEQGRFYGSAEWREGPRPELVDKIDTYVNTLLWSSEEAINRIRELNQPVAT